MTGALRRLLVRAYWRFWVLPRWRPASLGDVTDDGLYDDRADLIAEREMLQAGMPVMNVQEPAP